MAQSAFMFIKLYVTDNMVSFYLDTEGSENY